jgi:hypothetical protein
VTATGRLRRYCPAIPHGWRTHRYACMRRVIPLTRDVYLESAGPRLASSVADLEGVAKVPAVLIGGPVHYALDASASVARTCRLGPRLFVIKREHAADQDTSTLPAGSMMNLKIKWADSERVAGSYPSADGLLRGSKHDNRPHV